MAFGYAKRHNLFYDAPEVIKKADDLFARYQERDHLQWTTADSSSSVDQPTDR